MHRRGVTWALGEEEEHMTSSRGGPQEQPATPLVHTCAPLAAKGLPHYLKTASKQKIIWTSWVNGIAHGRSGRPRSCLTCSPPHHFVPWAF